MCACFVFVLDFVVLFFVPFLMCNYLSDEGGEDLVALPWLCSCFCECVCLRLSLGRDYV